MDNDSNLDLVNLLSKEEIKQFDLICEYAIRYVEANSVEIYQMFLTKIDLTPSTLKAQFLESDIKEILDSISDSDRIFWQSIFKFNEAKNVSADDHEGLIRLFVGDFVINNYRDAYLKNDNSILSEFPFNPFNQLNLPFFKDLLNLMTKLELIDNLWYYHFWLLNDKRGSWNPPTAKEIKESKKTSYVWLNNPEVELPELFDLMTIKHKLIAPETTYDQFKAVFTGQPVNQIEPIKWHQDNASELLFFIDRLEDSSNIIGNPNRADHQKLIACFVKPDGSQFTANLKQLKQNITISLSPDKQKAIDELLKNFA